MKKIKLFIRQCMMRYLRKHGWVVFYLEPRDRKCNGLRPLCWLQLYNQEMKRKETMTDAANKFKNWWIAGAILRRLKMTTIQEFKKNYDPGHDAAEEIVQTEHDDHYGDIADTQSKRVLSDKTIMPDPIWTFCGTIRCMTQRNHILVGGVWVCSTCGQKNKHLPVAPSERITKVAESYLEANPEED